MSLFLGILGFLILGIREEENIIAIKYNLHIHIYRIRDASHEWNL